MKNRYISPRAKVIVLDAESELMSTSDIKTFKDEVPTADYEGDKYNMQEYGVSNGNGIWDY